MTREILRTNGLTKNYGNLLAINGLNLSVPENSIYGILGPNGSGKSTTLSIILGVINATNGTYSWFDNQNTDHSRKRIGALLEQPNFYPYLSAYNNLKITCQIKEVEFDRIDPILKQVGLLERKDSKFRTFSTGMKQRLAIGATLLADPEIIVLDEPTNGLDPKGIVEVRNLIKDIGQKGKTIILASHLLDEVEKVCTHYAVLQKGKLIESNTMAEIRNHQNRFFISSSDIDNLMNWIKGTNKVGILSQGEAGFSIETDLNAEDLNRLCFENGFVLTQLITKHKTLEDQFLEIIR